MPTHPISRGGGSRRGTNRGRLTSRRGGYNRARRDQSDTGSGYRSNQFNLQNVVGSLTSVLDSIKERLNNLEGNTGTNNRNYSNNTNRRQQDNVQYEGIQRPRTNNQPKRWSQNPDFKQLIRLNTKYVQLQHHYQNWRDCPKGVSKAIDNLVANIRPPQPSDEFKGYLKEAAEDFKSTVAGILQAHLHLESNKMEQQMATLQQTDQDLMQSIVTNKLKKRLGRRISDDTIKAAFDRYKQYHPTTIHDAHPVADAECDDDESAAMETDQRKQSSKRPHSRTSNQSTPSSRPAKIQLNSDSPSITQGDRQVIRAAAELAAEASTSNQHHRNTTVASSSRRSCPKLIYKTARELRNWSFDSVDSTTTTVILADSNGSAFADVNVPDKYQVFSFSGMNLKHAARLLTTSDQQLRHTHNIVMAVGINDRDATDDTEIMSDLKAINDWGHHHQKRIVFTAIPISPKLNGNTSRTVSHINELARDIFEDNFIPSVDTSEFVLRPDKFGIHYTSSTADKVLSVIINHLN